MKLNIALAQIKVVSGDLEGNTNRILEGIQKSINENVDIVVFPELCISGYNIGLLFEQEHFIEYQTRFINEYILPKVPANLVVILGCIITIGKKMDGSPNITNSLLIIQNGQIINTYSKIFLAGKNHHEDFRYFSNGEHPVVTKLQINNQTLKIGTVICEDMWSDFHERDIVNETVRSGAELIISINQSYFYYGKQNIRRTICTNHALKNKIPFFSCNNVGVGDAGAKNMIVYDGGSMAVDKSGKIIKEAKRFEEDFIIVNFDMDGENNIIENLKPYNKFEEIYNAIVYAQKEIFKDLGFEKAMVCISGGLDSSVTLPIVVEAMGKENVYALSMPTKYNSDLTKSNVKQLCDVLGVKLYWETLNKVQESFVNAFTDTFNVKPQSLQISTFDAVGRTVAGIAASQYLQAGLVSTSNHTEIVLNWFSWHDISTAAVYGPLADLSKVEIYELGAYINKKWKKEIVPLNLIDGTTIPNPELADATQGAKWNYFIVSGICCLLVRDKMDISDIVQLYINKELPVDYFPLDYNGNSIYELVPDEKEFIDIVKMCFNRQKSSVYKASQACGMLMLTTSSRNFSNHESMINHYKGAY